MTEPPVEFVLDIPRCGEPVCGTLRWPDHERRFRGWVEFACALQDAGEWRARSLRLALEPVSSDGATPPEAADAEALEGWVAVAAALHALSCVQAGADADEVWGDV